MEKNDDAHAIKTIADLRKEFAPIQNTNEIHRQHLSVSDKIALSITRRVGTMEFFYFCIVLAAAPIAIPAALPLVQYISSGFLQLVFLPLIMVGQNLQGRHAELRAEHDYATNVKAEKEIEAILLHLEKQDEIMLDILRRIEKLEKQK
jgi:uncharacterized membrane protein